MYYSNDNIQKYDKIIQKVVQEKKVFYCPMYDLLKNKDLPDGVHPNSEGHKKIFLRVKNFLIEKKLINL